MLEAVTTSLPVKVSPRYPLSYQEAKENWPTAPHDTFNSIISRQITPKKQTMSDRSSPSNRWRLNGASQDTAAPQWELSDELSRLKIGSDANGDGSSHQTPAKPLALTSVQRGDTSPSSIASGKSSPRSTDHHAQDSHSRASSIDTNNLGAQDTSFSKVLLGKSQASLALTPEIEHRERPHSFSGGLSAADLRRLQQAGDFTHDTSDNQKQWSRDAAVSHEQQASEQLSYPSLTNNGVQRNVAQPQRYEVRVQPRDELQVDYNTQQRNFTPIAPGQQPTSPTHQSFTNRPANIATPPYRPSQRGFTPGIASPTQMAYHSLGNGQQLYELGMPGAPHEHPAVARVQQQHNVYPRSHHHTTSDPTIRDPATLALLNGGVQPFAPGMFQPPMATPMHVYPNQYFAGTDFTRPDVIAAQNLAARLQPQYTGQYGIPQMLDGSMPSPPASNGSTGPSANNRKLGLYKTELCRSWEEKGTCRYGAKCQFAHGEDELRSVSRHPKYKTEICRTFWVSGSCPYGKRCCFIHTELPANGSAAAPANSDGGKPGHSRERSSSTNSDPNDASSSLLARIRNQEPSAVTPVDSKQATFQILGRPTISVNTALDGSSMKQNKSAFPTFAGNVLIPSKDNGSLKSPAPVTAGPDIGRHNNFSYGPTRHKTSSSSSSIRNSFNGEDLEAFSPTPPSSSLNYNAPDSPASAQTPRGPGHVRAGSSGNWGNIGRTSLGASSFPSAAAELPGSSPWSTSELAVGSSRLHEKSWN